MPLVSLTSVLQQTRSLKYAVASFNVVTLEMVAGVLSGAEAKHSPLIIGLAARHFGLVEPWLLAAAIQKGAERAVGPVVFHLDHAESMEAVRLGVELGCTSVMIDGSRLSLEENVELTERVVAYAHSKNVSVEAELGAVGGKEGEVAGGRSSNLYTDPQEAREFVRRTNVDALAVGIGTVHGLYRSAPNLQFDLLAAIAAEVDTPLVLHGGTGLSEHDFSRMIDLGISKINVFTELAVSCSERLRANLAKHPAPASIADIVQGIPQDVSSIAGKLMTTFGSTGRV